MTTQTEQALENNLIARLASNGYERVTIKDQTELLANFKTQLEKHNHKKLAEAGNPNLSADEFNKILIHLEGGNTFKKAEKLRTQYELDRDGRVVYIEFINQREWCKNHFQVTNQVTDKGKFTTRYDVTILINGLPLVQIELKRRGLELKEAFKQIKRYHKHSFTGLFSYIQIFVVSNGVNTKYFANNSLQSFKQTFFWTDVENKKHSQLDDFTDTFLEKCHVAKMITRYIVLHQSDKVLMILRPYQYFAVEAIIKRVEETRKNGYIWHTTGSGKTLTSFKAAQLLIPNNKVDKILFVVDRKDLDYQTTREFNSFSPDSVDGTDNTRSLVKQLSKTQNKLVVTTIQKLTKAIKTNRYESAMKTIQDKRVIFIFDECHRSQFGKMHTAIMDFFTDHQSFGFTGTPILEPNANKGKTTLDLFHKRLHTYVIKDAIADENVLGFSVEHKQTFSHKKKKDDEKVEAIDTKEVLESPKRIGKIVDDVLTTYNRKTFNREFTSILVAPNIPTLCQYYDLFKKREHKLNIATIFSFTPNEEEWDDDDNTPPEHSRDKLQIYMQDYNKLFGSDYSTDTFDAYYVNVAKRVRNKEIDILIVVNMFLTGFDSKTLNTLFVDKNMVYHNLVQAFSRTNRTYNEKKKHGNIVCYRNLKDNTDEAIRLYSDKDAKETLDTVLMKSYDEYLDMFNKQLKTLRKIAPDLQAVDDLQSETEKEGFVVAFRELLRLKTRLSTFSEFTFDDTTIGEQDFEDYTSKYRDLYESVRNNSEPEKVSILDDIDFEIELLKRDDINVDYILELLKQLDFKDKSFKKEKEFILSNLSKSVELQSKKELIEKFINENIPHITDTDTIEEEFEKFVAFEREKELEEMVTEEHLDKEKVTTVLDEFEFTGKLRKPLLKESITEKLGFKEKRIKLKLLQNKVMNFIEKFAF